MSERFPVFAFQRAIRASSLSGHEKAVAMMLSTYIDDEGRAFPSLETLASATGFSRATVCRAVDVLVGRGWVRRLRQGRTTSNTYQLQVVSSVEESQAETSPAASSLAATSPVETTHVAGGDVRGLHERPATSLGETRSPQGSTHLTTHVTDTGSGEPAALHLAIVEKATKKPKAKAEATPEHRKLIAYYVEVYEKLRGCKPEITAKHHVAANRLLGNGRGLGGAMHAIDRAFATDFVRNEKPDLAYIAANVNAYVGTVPTRAKGGQPPVQPAAAPGERAYALGKLRMQGQDHDGSLKEWHQLTADEKAVVMRKARSTPQHSPDGTPPPYLADENALQEKLAKEAAEGGSNAG